jgi:leucyl aminopeptidase
MALGSYQFLKYFSNPSKKEKILREIRLENTTVSEADIQETNAVLEAVFLTRDLVNEPHSHFNAVHLAEAVVAAGHTYGFSVDILGKDKIEALKMGGLLAVNRASTVPPQFCILEWKPEGARNAKPIVLVGKGVVYDTGGLSLKPTEGMTYMKCDMAGAAAVVGTLAVAAKTGLPLHLIGLIPATDNKIGENALSPGDVITMGSGTTVEVVNTDAEGRLILADALHFAQKYDPELVVDLATLTGSAVKALGTQVICYMGTASEKIKKQLESSGFDTYERLVELPLWKEFGDELKSNIADLKNLGSSNAGMITAGKFLEHFTKFPWLHLDIAGPAYLRAANGYRTKEGTGVGVRLLFDFLKKL